MTGWAPASALGTHALASPSSAEGARPSTAPLNVSVVATPTSGSAPLHVNFSAATTGGVGPFSFSWAFGDGAGGTGTPILHTYVQAGTFTSTVTVTDSAGVTATASTVVVVQGSTGSGNLTVTASVSPSSGPAPLTCAFSATATGGTAPYSYVWVFSSGASVSGASITETFASAGTYTGAVTATDAKGDVATASVTVTVTGNGSANLSVVAIATPSQGSAPLTTWLNATASGGTTPISFAWALDNGAHATTADVLTTYSAAGSYTAWVWANDSAGMSAEASVVVVVTGNGTSGGPFIVNATASPASGSAPLTTTLTATASGGTPPYTFVWSLANGASAAGASVTETFSSPGTYGVVVDATDASGQVATASVVITVNGTSSADQLLISANPSSGPAPLATTLNATVVSAAGGILGGFSYTWNFGDGSSGSGGTVSHTFYNAGTYAVSVDARDATLGANLTLTASTTIVAYGGGSTNGTGGLLVSIAVSPATGPAPLAVSFSGSVQGGTAPYVYDWEFGDGSGATGASVAHTYTSAGVYDASLTVASANGLSAYTAVLITATGPGVNSTASGGLRVTVTTTSTEGVAPFTASFLPTVVGGTGPYTLTWNFGDGSSLDTVTGTSTVSHTYTKGGSYVVTVQAVDSKGAKASWSTQTQGVPSVQVVTPVQHGGGTTLWNQDTVAVIAVLAVAIVILLAVAMTRRNPRNALPPPGASFSPPASGNLWAYDRYGPNGAALPPEPSGGPGGPAGSAARTPGGAPPSSPPARDPLGDMV